MMTVTSRDPESHSVRLDSMAGTSTNQWLSPTPWSLVAGAPFTRRSWHELLYAWWRFPRRLWLCVRRGIALRRCLLVGHPDRPGGLRVVHVGSTPTRGIQPKPRTKASRRRRPTTAPFQPGLGVVGWVRAGLVDRAGWRARAYLVLKFPLALASFIAVITLRLGSLWFILAPAQWAANIGTENTRNDGDARHYVINFGSSIGHVAADPAAHDHRSGRLVAIAVGVAGDLVPDRQLLADLLGPTSLPVRVRQLERARAGVVDDAAARLRRLERDLHDGAQAELVGLSMKLGLAEEKLAHAEQQSPPEVAHARRWSKRPTTRQRSTPTVANLPTVFTRQYSTRVFSRPSTHWWPGVHSQPGLPSH